MKIPAARYNRHGMIPTCLQYAATSSVSYLVVSVYQVLDIPAFATFYGRICGVN